MSTNSDLETSFESIGEEGYNNADDVIVIEDEAVPEYPSERHGGWSEPALFAGVFCFTALLVAALFIWSRRQERRKSMGTYMHTV